MSNIINKFSNLINKTMSSTNKSGYSILNSHSTIFKGYGRTGNIELGNTNMLDLEDPTYLVFDINIDNQTTGDGTGSPLFDSNIKEFFINYGSEIGKEGIVTGDNEITNAYYAYIEFIKILSLIFPDTENKNGDAKSGSKRHYINSISGLDILNKKIINFPEDKITIKLSEDVTMLSQYLSELYLDMTYSYATNRQLVPDNLLRFDMYIIMSDIRDMKYGKNQSNTSKYGGYIDNIVDNKSKFIYVLHDCQFDFTASKIHGSDMTVGGFATAAPNTPASMDINIIFKSYSRILIPALFMNSSVADGYILDYKTQKFGFNDNSNKTNQQTKGPIKLKKYSRTTPQSPETNNATQLFDLFNRDYLNQTEYDNTNPTPKNLDGIDETATYGTTNTESSTFLSKLGNTVTQKVKSLQSSLQNNAINQADKLKEDIQKSISNVTGINLTTDRVNVYYDTVDQKVDKLTLLASNLISRTESALQKTVTKTIENIGNTITGSHTDWSTTVSGYGKIVNADETIGVFSGKKTSDSLDKNSVYDTKNTRKNIYNREENDIDNVYDKTQSIENVLTEENIYDENKNNTTNLEKTNLYNKKSINNTLSEKNIYNIDTNKEYTRTGEILTNDNFYNDKTPNQDVYKSSNNAYENGLYEKYKDTYETGILDDAYKSNLYEDNNSTLTTYTDANGKLVTGFNHYNTPPSKDYFKNEDRHIDSTYNEKYPNGRVHDNGKYNENFPDGKVDMTGKHNEKYPDGDLHENGEYNKNYPIGKVEMTGEYNEKYPDGNVDMKGSHNEKYPEGSREEDGKYNLNYPSGDRHVDSSYNQNYPSGDRHEDGKHNENYPIGRVDMKGKHNEKYPDGDLHSTGKYNKNYPIGSVDMKGKHNEKYPDGDRHEEGKHNEKFPSGSREENGKYNLNYPEGKVEMTGTYNKNYPDGDLHEEGKHNEKYPVGEVNMKGKHNEKYPTGDVHEESKHNENYPKEESRQEKGKHNENYPDGDLHEDGKHNENYPNNNNVYKNRK